jgi:hypothetical protein
MRSARTDTQAIPPVTQMSYQEVPRGPKSSIFDLLLGKWILSSAIAGLDFVGIGPRKHTSPSEPFEPKNSSPETKQGLPLNSRCRTVKPRQTAVEAGSCRSGRRRHGSLFGAFRQPPGTRPRTRRSPDRRQPNPGSFRMELRCGTAVDSGVRRLIAPP